MALIVSPWYVLVAGVSGYDACAWPVSKVYQSGLERELIRLFKEPYNALYRALQDFLKSLIRSFKEPYKLFEEPHKAL